MEVTTLKKLGTTRRVGCTYKDSEDDVWKELAAGAEAVVTDIPSSRLAPGCRCLRSFGKHYKTATREDGKTIVYMGK